MQPQTGERTEPFLEASIGWVEALFACNHVNRTVSNLSPLKEIVSFGGFIEYFSRLTCILLLTPFENLSTHCRGDETPPSIPFVLFAPGMFCVPLWFVQYELCIHTASRLSNHLFASSRLFNEGNDFTAAELFSPVTERI